MNHPRSSTAALLAASALALAACGAPGSAKEETLEQHIPPVGQLPPLPSSYFPPPPEETAEPATAPPSTRTPRPSPRPAAA